MATETKAPDTLITQTGLTGAVTAIDESVDTPDGSWLTAPGSNTATEARVSFPTPTGDPTVGANLQTLRAWVRKTNHSTNPTAVLALIETGGGTNLAATSSIEITSTTGQMLTLTFNANLLVTATGSAVEARVIGTVGGGAAANRASVEVGAVEWNVDYTPGQNYPLAIDPAAVSLTAINVTLVYVPTSQVPEDGTYYQGGVPSAITPTVVCTDGTILNVAPGLAGTAQRSQTTIITPSTAHRYAKYLFTQVATDHFRVRWYFDQETLLMTAGATANIVSCFENSTGATRAYVRLLYDGTVHYRLRVTVKDDGATDRLSAYVTIGDSWPAYVDLYIRRATSNVAADGYGQLFFDGSETPATEITGVDIYDTFTFDEIWIGQAAGFSSAATASGTVSFDEIKISDGATIPAGAYTLGIDPATMTVTAVDASVVAQYGLSLDPVSIALATVPVTLAHGATLNLTETAISLAMVDVGIVHAVPVELAITLLEGVTVRASWTTVPATVQTEAFALTTQERDSIGNWNDLSVRLEHTGNIERTRVSWVELNLPLVSSIDGIVIDPDSLAVTTVDVTMQVTEPPTAYDLTVEPTSVSLTMNAVEIPAHRVFSIDPSSVTASAVNPTILAHWLLAIDTAELGLTAIDSMLAKHVLSAIDPAVMDLVAVNIAMLSHRNFQIDQMALDLTSVDATMARHLVFAIDPATLTVTPVNPSLVSQYELNLDPASTELTPVDALLLTHYGLNLDSATLGLTTVDLTFQASGAPNAYALSIDAASVSLAPLDSSLPSHRVFSVEPGTVLLSLTDSTVVRHAGALIDPATTQLVMFDPALTNHAQMAVDPASVNATPTAVAVIGQFSLAVEPATMEIVTIEATLALVGSYALTVETASLACTLTDAALSKATMLSVDPAVVDLTPVDATMVRGYRLSIDSAAVTISTLDVVWRGAFLIPIDPAQVTLLGVDAEVTQSLKLSVAGARADTSRGVSHVRGQHVGRYPRRGGRT